MAEGVALTIELRLLAYVAFLSLVIWVPYIIGTSAAKGLAAVAGYPSGDYRDLPDWVQRCHRVHMNLIENLLPFGVLVLIAQVVGVSNETTILGAHLFFWARLAKAAIHMFGIPWVRTGAFVVGWIGCLMIFWEVITV